MSEARSNFANRWLRKTLTFTFFMVSLTTILCARTPVREMRWYVILDYRDLLIRGVLVSVAMTVIAFIVSIVPAILLAFGRISESLTARVLSIAVIEMIRSVPELMVIFWIFFTAPMLVGHALGKYTSGIAALTVVNTAYLAEAVRAGILSVPGGLRLAGLAGGMTPWQTRLHIILPIALRNMLPELRNRFVSLFKSTALLYVIGVVEFFNALTIVDNREIVPFVAMITAGLVYFTCAYALELGTRWIDQRR